MGSIRWAWVALCNSERLKYITSEWRIHEWPSSSLVLVLVPLRLTPMWSADYHVITGISPCTVLPMIRHTANDLLCVVVVWMGRFYSYLSGLLHWTIVHKISIVGFPNTVASIPVMQPWIVWVKHHMNPQETQDDVIKWKHFPRYWPFVGGNHRSPAGGFPSQKPVTRRFDVLFGLRLNSWLRKRSRRWWFETPSCSLWCHCNGIHVNSWTINTKQCTIETVSIFYGIYSTYEDFGAGSRYLRQG